MKKLDLTRKIPRIVIISAICFSIFSTLPNLAFAESKTESNSKNKNQQPEIDYTTLNELDKPKLIMVIKCLTTKDVNSDEAISNCLPLVSKPPQNPPKKDISALPVVKIIYPNGGEKLIEGTIIKIKYTATSTNTVDIKLWNESAPTADIASNLPPEGIYEWKVKASAGYNSNYAISIRGKNANGSSYDISDSYLKISKSSTTTLATSTVANSSDIWNSPQAANAQLIIEKIKGIFKAFTY